MVADKRRAVPHHEKQRIIDLYKDGHSNKVIAERIGRSVRVVQRIVAQFKATGFIISPPKTGIPRKTSLREDRLIARLSLKRRLDEQCC